MSSDGYLTTWISVDANAVIDYIRECALRDLRKDPTGPEAEMLRVRLDQQRHVFIAKTAGEEAASNMKKDITHKLESSDPDAVLDRALALLEKYRDKVERDDKIEYVPAIKQMYAAIKTKPSSSKFKKWKRRKRRHKNNPELGSDINDLVILSTTVHYLQIHKVEFWTRDMDFAIFANEIHETFGLKVVDTRRLGE